MLLILDVAATRDRLLRVSKLCYSDLSKFHSDFLPNTLKTRELYLLWQIHRNCENILSLNVRRFSFQHSDLNPGDFDPFMQTE